MERVHLALDAPGLGRAGTLIRYGYFGRPVIAFPTEGGHAWDFEDNGMVSAMRPLLEAGRIKLYCVDSFDDVTWSDRWISVEDRARKHRHFESWITGPVSQWIADDSPGADSPIVTGCGLGAYHALQLALTRADMFPIAICMSGNYDPSTWHAWGEPGDDAYFTNPTAYVPGLHGANLEWLQQRVHVVLTVGQGIWESHPTGALASTQRMAALLAEKDIPCELDIWGSEATHDWPWWRAQISCHLPQFC